MASILSGKEVAAALTDALVQRTEALKAKGVSPTLAIVRVGEREDDLSYERGAMKRCEKIGVAVRQFLLPADTTQEALLDTIRQVNEDAGIHGCLLFRPLPKQIDDEVIRQALAPEKDVDGITDGSLAGVFAGTEHGFPPCTAQACMEILAHYGYDLKGKRAVVMGRSLVIGKPVAMMLLKQNATVTICHTRTVDMPARCKEADVLVVAAGRAGVVDASYVSPGQVVVDVGINVNAEGKLCGDVAFDQVEPVVGAITPVPGGVGSVTTCVLVEHVVTAAERASR
ncbi:bifunctional 5,10-methylenetetrahydrofolate dehydrogenase/5,10-methenyltetrahydrofolate cyclohydrolase [Pseudoflavonifractor sp. MSJ-37]|uniref:bifunctional 5,10-methylenetetrahydrofolate dehydrogenase/5,10-methenyltetrahydrofolate cyclohydrolase n=1 Tax=Pseudoflavonifractor sp. MSJ-37 TaxID=2841531 RepID=UPI001C0F90F8|nr:bifunctional 5,10-methylenetetrahydrofolate dehydrogenase/5,10-methenyltetrahydrofolate cyclohydrolase [Pseudoflavonifractor sp. MSJ-37]MBU5435484.1 bifunctional 5,10-methylenetetrahydrofolate dehydrogenase/5,10-methenyltetrahydrofolate cyclohydrolase [Pseudoflavonifractor sp. MSJ-37]